MPSAVRVQDQTNHAGIIIGPGAATVLIAGKPAAVAFDIHKCNLPPDTHPLTSSPFPKGSTTVLIEGRQAIRAGDACVCGAVVLGGESSVQIG